MTASRIFGGVHVLLAAIWSWLALGSLGDNLDGMVTTWALMAVAAVVSLAVGLQAVIRPPAFVAALVASSVLTVFAWATWLSQVTDTTPGQRLDSGSGRWATYGFMLLGGGATLLLGVTTVALFITALATRPPPASRRRPA